LDYSQIPVLLTLAFGLGMLHSLDADHIMAVSNLAQNNQHQGGIKNSIHFCLHWACGHGLVLFLVGVVVFILGVSLPAELSLYAEMVVAAVLIVIGLFVLYDVWQRRIHIHFHQHDNLPKHAHWHSHANQNSHRHSHTALFVGMLHGLAGFAPLLAIIPATMTSVTITQRAWSGFLYLIIFSLGVLAAMLLFGGVLGYFSKFIASSNEKIFRLLRTFLGLGAIGVGSIMLMGSLA